MADHARNLLLTITVLMLTAVPAASLAQWEKQTRAGTVPELKPRAVLITHGRGIDFAIAFAPSGKNLIVAGGVGQIPRPFSPPGRGQEGLITRPTDRSSFDEAEDGQGDHPLSITGERVRDVRRPPSRQPERTAYAEAFDVQTGRARPLIAAPGRMRRCYSIAISQDGKTAATIAERHHLMVWDLTTGTLRATHELWFEDLACSSDGHRLLGLDSDDAIHLYDLATGKKLGTIHTKRALKSAVNRTSWSGGLAFSPGGTQFAWGFSLWDTKSGRLLSAAKSGARCGTIVGPDGQDVVGLFDQSPFVQTWHVSTGKVRESEFQVRDKYSVMKSAYGSGDAVKKIAMSPDGRLFATAHPNVVRVWEFAGRKLLANCPLTGRDGFKLVGLTFSPDGRTLATADRFGRTQLWDVSPLVAE